MRAACAGYDGYLWSGASAPLPMNKLDCFVALLLAMTTRVVPASTRLALARRRAMRPFGRAMRRAARGGMRRPLCRCPSCQALLKCIHQADNIVRPFLGLRNLDRLAGGLALDQGLQRIFVFVLEFRRVEMRRLGIEDMAGEFDHVFRNLRILDVVEIFLFVAHLVRIPQR